MGWSTSVEGAREPAFTSVRPIAIKRAEGQTIIVVEGTYTKGTQLTQDFGLHFFHEDRGNVAAVATAADASQNTWAPDASATLVRVVQHQGTFVIAGVVDPSPLRAGNYNLALGYWNTEDDPGLFVALDELDGEEFIFNVR